MGLLDGLFDSEQGRMGLGLLAAGSARGDGAGFGQRLSEAVGSVDQWKKAKAQAEYQKQQAAAQQQQMAMQAMQMQQYQAQAAQQQAAQEAAARKQAALPGLFSAGSNGAPALNVDSLLPPEMRAGTMPQPAVPPQQAGINVQRALMAGYSPEEIVKLDGLRNIGQNKVARTVKGMQNGREVEQQFDDYGRPVGQGMEQFKAPIMVDRGGQVDAVSPYMQPGQSFPKTMTFADRNAAGNLSVSRERLAFDQTQNGGQGKAPAGYKWSADGTALEAIPGGPAAGNKLTESESKSTLYLSQMRDATKVLNTLGDKTSPTMIAATGSPYTNWMAGGNSQKAGQAQRQWAEAYLREKTGAAATPGEVENNIRTFFPVVGDTPEVITQKKSARESAEKAMEIPAGRGASRIPSNEKPPRTVEKTGTYGGRKVIQYSDGTTEYAN